MEPIFENDGYCPICESDTKFKAYDPWLRDYYICSICESIPRERALIEVINNFAPNWKSLIIHESSPAMKGASLLLRNECGKYIASQYFNHIPSGEIVDGVRSENLESLTFEDNSIDIHITQDVLEHVFNPKNAFQEIARTLAPGGMHIFTVPLVNKKNPSKRRAARDIQGNVKHLREPSYHKNPIGDGESLVTIDWGYDICEHIQKSCGLFTQIVYIDDLSKGIRAEYIEVLVTQKNNTATFDSFI